MDPIHLFSQDVAALSLLGGVAVLEEPEPLQSVVKFLLCSVTGTALPGTEADLTFVEQKP